MHGLRRRSPGSKAGQLDFRSYAPGSLTKGKRQWPLPLDPTAHRSEYPVSSGATRCFLRQVGGAHGLPRSTAASFLPILLLHRPDPDDDAGSNEGGHVVDRLVVSGPVPGDETM